MSKKVFIAFAHPKYKSGESFNSCVRDEFIKSSKERNFEIDLMNIYEEKTIKFWDGSPPDNQILDIQNRMEKADIIFISVNTPTKQKGVGAGKASDLKYIENCARTVARYSKGHTIVVEKSTIPVRTADTIKQILFASQEIEVEKDQTNDENQLLPKELHQLQESQVVVPIPSVELIPNH